MDGGGGMDQIGVIDGFDARILRLLSEDGRLSWRDLSDRVGLSLTPTLRRVRALEAQGYIRGYAARLDEQRLAGSMIVFVNVRTSRTGGEPEGFEEAVSRFPEIMDAFLMSGGSDYLLRVVVRDIDQLRELIWNLSRIEGVLHLRSSVALKSFIHRPPPISHDAACPEAMPSLPVPSIEAEERGRTR